MFQTKFAEKIRTHILGSITVFLKSCCLSDNVENILEPDRPQTTTWRMRIPCWLPKATHTHTQNV